MYSGLRLYQYTEDDFSNKVLVSAFLKLQVYKSKHREAVN